MAHGYLFVACIQRAGFVKVTVKKKAASGKPYFGARNVGPKKGGARRSCSLSFLRTGAGGARFWGRFLDPKMGAAFCVKNIAEAECATREPVSARKRACPKLLVVGRSLCSALVPKSPPRHAIPFFGPTFRAPKWGPLCAAFCKQTSSTCAAPQLRAECSCNLSTLRSCATHDGRCTPRTSSNWGGPSARPQISWAFNVGAQCGVAEKVGALGRDLGEVPD